MSETTIGYLMRSEHFSFITWSPIYTLINSMLPLNNITFTISPIQTDHEWDALQ